MDAFRTCPFTIIVDSNETAPFPFAGFTTKGTRKNEPEKIPLIIPTERQALWALNRREVQIKGESYSVGFADYSIKGLEQQVSIERKSVSDLFGTLSSRRGKFEAEICRLHEDCEFAAVIVEGSWPEILVYRETGLNPNSVVGTIVAWMQRYNKVHWVLAPSRAAAERLTFRMLERFWEERDKR
jgi:ERCC4-type nuclease